MIPRNPIAIIGVQDAEKLRSTSYVSHVIGAFVLAVSPLMRPIYSEGSWTRMESPWPTYSELPMGFPMHRGDFG